MIERRDPDTQLHVACPIRAIGKLVRQRANVLARRQRQHAGRDAIDVTRAIAGAIGEIGQGVIAELVGGIRFPHDAVGPSAARSDTAGGILNQRIRRAPDAAAG